MKVLAENGTGFIVQLTATEASNMIGLSYSDGTNKIREACRTGVDLPISKIYNNHEELRTVLIGDNVKRARKELENLLKRLTPIEDIVSGLPTIK